MSAPPWTENPFCYVKRGDVFDVIAIPQRILPSEFPGNNIERSLPMFVCTTATKDWAKYIVEMLADAYDGVIDERDNEARS